MAVKETIVPSAIGRRVKRLQPRARTRRLALALMRVRANGPPFPQGDSFIGRDPRVGDSRAEKAPAENSRRWTSAQGRPRRKGRLDGAPSHAQRYLAFLSDSAARRMSSAALRMIPTPLERAS